TETAPPKEAVRKPELRPQVTAKPSAANPAPSPTPVATAPVVSDQAKRDPAVSDSQWLDAVRQALVTRKLEPPAPAARQSDPRSASPQPHPLPAPALRLAPQDAPRP